MPDRSHVEFLSSTIGLLRFNIVKSYSTSIKHLRDRADSYRTTQLHAGREPNILPSVYTLSVESNYQQLLTLESTLHHIRLCMIEMQNSFHFATATLDWLQLYAPRYDGLTPSASTALDVIGTFIHDVKEASRLVCSGVPVWVVKPFVELQSTRIYDTLPVTDPSEMLDLIPYPGSSTVQLTPGEASFRYMSKYYSTCLAGTNPFIVPSPSLTSPQCASQSLSRDGSSSCSTSCLIPCKLYIIFSLPFINLLSDPSKPKKSSGRDKVCRTNRSPMATD